MNTKRIAGIAAASSLALGGVAVLASPAMAAEGDLQTEVVQAVGLPVSGTCTAIDDASLNWGGVPSGGWSAGWGQWLNDGKGGAACVRTLKFAESTGTWFVAS